MPFEIRVPADSDRGPMYMDQALAALHQANPRHLPLTLSIGRQGESVGLSYDSPGGLEGTVKEQLYAAYPDCTIRMQADDKPRPGYAVFVASLWLKPEIFPIRRHAEFFDPQTRTSADPLATVLAALAPETPDLHARVEITLRPARPDRVQCAKEALALIAPFRDRHPRIALHLAALLTSESRLLRFLGRCARARIPGETPNRHLHLESASSRSHDREGDIEAAADKLGRHLFEVHLRLIVEVPVGSDQIAHAKMEEFSGALGHLTLPGRATFRLGRVRSGKAPPPVRGRGFLLSSEELATLWHPPTATVRTEKLAVSSFRELEPPTLLPKCDSEGAAILGRVRFRGRRDLVAIARDDRRHHLAIIGKTGMGKSTLLRSLMRSDIVAGKGIALLDPHGDLSEEVLSGVPSHRTNDVVLFDPSDRDFPLAWNPLACDDPRDRPLVASGIIAAFKKIHAESWGPRLEHILRHALLAVLEIPSTSLLSLLRLLSDSSFRRSIAARLKDPLVRSFWEEEFARWKPAFQAEAVSPIQNKIGQALTHPILRSILGQSQSRLDLRRVMESSGILIANLSKGRLGEDGSALLGSLLVNFLQLAAMRRAEQSEAERRDFYLYVDEFQNFATEGFATILSEARKYRLNLTIANQYLAQMEDQTLEAVFGNVGTLLTFQVGARDSELLAEQLGGDVVPRDLLMLPQFTAHVRLLMDGMPNRPFSIETLAGNFHADSRRSDVIRRASRQRHARPLLRVQEEIGSALAAI